MGAMGERFMLLRLGESDADEQARPALAYAGHEKEMRAELAAAVGALLARLLSPIPPLREDKGEWLFSLATFAVRCRSSIERDSYSREIRARSSSCRTRRRLLG
jgi:hypothetical protein